VSQETLECKAVRLELERARVDLRTDPVRAREFKLLCEALGRSKKFLDLVQDFSFSVTIALENGSTIHSTALILAAISTGIQLGIDVQGARDLKKQGAGE